jgi:hypothetical protein
MAYFRRTVTFPYTLPNHCGIAECEEINITQWAEGVANKCGIAEY